MRTPRMMPALMIAPLPAARLFALAIAIAAGRAQDPPPAPQAAMLRMSPSRKTSSLLSFTPFQVATAVTPTAMHPPRPDSTISPGAGAVSWPNRCSGSSTTTQCFSPT